MHGRRFIHPLGTLSLLSVLLLAGCGATSVPHSALTLTYWYTDGAASAPVTQQLIAQFERQNPTIHINARAVDLASAYGQFVAAARAGQSPDALRISAN